MRRLCDHAIAAVALTSVATAETPDTLFLTWDDDPTTTMTVQWIADEEASRAPRLEWRPADAETWTNANGVRYEFGPDGLYVCRIRLAGLVPGGVYEIRATPDDEVLFFETLPDTLDEPIVFVSGGDAGPNGRTRMTCTAAARRDPHFAVLGGDLAYADAGNTQAWVSLLADWHELMRAPDRRIIPLIVSIGNHEVEGGYAQSRENAPLFLALFAAYHERSYRVVDVGDYLSIVFLDSWHTTPIGGEQTEWLEETLAARADVPHVFCIYHMPIYPSHRDYYGPQGRQEMRHLWAPLFERYGVDCVYEHDDHDYKRTWRIRNERVDPDGVLYLGDGCWGQLPRVVRTPEATWYLHRSKAINHFIETVITSSGRTHTAIDMHGRVFDRVETGF